MLGGNFVENQSMKGMCIFKRTVALKITTCRERHHREETGPAGRPTSVSKKATLPSKVPRCWKHE